MEAAGAVDAKNAAHRSLENLRPGFPQLPQGNLKKSVFSDWEDGTKRVPLRQAVLRVALEQFDQDEAQRMTLESRPAFHPDPEVVWDIPEQIRHASDSASDATM